MQRKDFLAKSILALPAITGFHHLIAQSTKSSTTKPFIVDAGKSRFGEVVKFLGVHPNDLKISGKDTNGQLAMFDYSGLGKVGPTLHVHFKQDEIFTVINGTYRFVVDDTSHTLNAGQTIFLPRNIPHTWIQLSETGRLIYLLQPAGKMEAFFNYMNNLKERPSQQEMDRIHALHEMKVLGPALSL
jgi:quercetin dioxygenase-like cupin family protein